MINGFFNTTFELVSSLFDGKSHQFSIIIRSGFKVKALSL